MCGGLGTGALALALPAAAPPRREAVLPQVKVPHAYYWREMYVPQVTSGPSGAAWSPDSRELAYAMQGTLWRQRLDGGEAVQLTDGRVVTGYPTNVPRNPR